MGRKYYVQSPVSPPHSGSFSLFWLGDTISGVQARKPQSSLGYRRRQQDICCTGVLLSSYTRGWHTVDQAFSRLQIPSLHHQPFSGHISPSSSYSQCYSG